MALVASAVERIGLRLGGVRYRSPPDELARGTLCDEDTEVLVSVDAFELQFKNGRSSKDRNPVPWTIDRLRSLLDDLRNLCRLGEAVTKVDQNADGPAAPAHIPKLRR
jgi:hypothetical protein